MKLKIDQIIQTDRIRKDYGTADQWTEFKESFRLNGQIQSITVTEIPGGYRLIAGGRRLRAITELHAEGVAIEGLEAGEIEATVKLSMSERKALLLEFAENNDRKDFDFVEKAKWIRSFHESMVSETEDAWTQDLTAQALNLSRTSISHYLRIEQAVQTNEAVAKASTLSSAVKRMKTAEKLQVRHEEAKANDNDAFRRAENILALADARDWIKTISDGSVALVNFDPPWGDDTSHKSAANHEGFTDDTEYSDGLMGALLPELFRVLRPDGFCIFWYRSWAPELMRNRALSVGFNTTHTRTPCIWYKPDKLSDQNRAPDKQLIEAYEPFYLLRKGDPVFHERMESNVFAFSRVTMGSIIHPTEKPIELAQALIRLTTVPGEIVLDPTAGSSVFLDAALRCSRKALGCELSDTYHQRGITRLAEYLQTFKES